MWSKGTFVFVALCSLVSSEARTPRHSPIKLKELKYTGSDVGEPLILTSLVEQNKTEEAKAAAKVVLDGVAENIESYAGYLTVNKAFSSNLFFWFFPSKGDYKNDPLVLWLQGGPGTPSMYGLFYENGPFSVNEKGVLETREHSWHNNHSLIFIDNPVGTGFSFTNNGYARNQTQVGRELYDALKQFYQIFPELKKNEFFITGESYAGKYVPALAYTIHKNNPAAAEKINFKGVAIGNGYIDPKLQVGYAEFLYQIGLVDESTSLVIKDLEDKDVQYISERKYNESNDIISQIFDLYANVTGGANILNYLQDGSFDQQDMESFFNTPKARVALHVGNTTFGDDQVSEHLRDDVQKDDITPWFVEIVNNYRVVLYTGQLDVNVGYPLTLNFLKHVDFRGAAEFRNSTRKIWFVGEDVAGYVKTFGNFSDVLVRNAGHMVPTDQPRHAEDLIYRFTRNLPLGSDQ